MPISKKIKDLKEPLDVDLQLIATELDTSVKSMKYLCAEQMTDANTLDAFNKLVTDITQINGVEVTSFDDNTILYEYLDEAIVIHSVLGVIYILFDSMVTQKLENKLNSSKMMTMKKRKKRMTMKVAKFSH